MGLHVLVIVVWAVLFICTIPLLFKLEGIEETVLFHIVLLDASGLIADTIRVILGLPV